MDQSARERVRGVNLPLVSLQGHGRVPWLQVTSSDRAQKLPAATPITSSISPCLSYCLSLHLSLYLSLPSWHTHGQAQPMNSDRYTMTRAAQGPSRDVEQSEPSFIRCEMPPLLVGEARDRAEEKWRRFAVFGEFWWPFLVPTSSIQPHDRNGILGSR